MNQDVSLNQNAQVIVNHTKNAHHQNKSVSPVTLLTIQIANLLINVMTQTARTQDQSQKQRTSAKKIWKRVTSVIKASQIVRPRNNV